MPGEQSTLPGDPADGPGGQAVSAPTLPAQGDLAEGERRRLAATQAALLEVLLAQVVVLDARGTIVSLNDSWRSGATTSRLFSPPLCIGQNYLDLLEAATGPGADEACRAARAIRSVLDGKVSHAALEYGGPSPAERAGYRMTVTPVHGASPDQPAEGAVVIHTDIGERRQAEAEGERLNQLLRTLIDALPDVVYAKDAQGRFVVCNRATLALYGCDHERDLIGRSVFDLLPADAAERAHADDLQVLAGRSILDREEHGTDRAGTSRSQRTIKVPLRDTLGRVVGLVGVRRDMTERTRAQEESRGLAERLGKALDGLSGGLCTLDRDGRLTYANWQAERMLGCSPTELLGKVIWDCVPALAGSPFEDALQRALQQGVVVEVVQRCAPLDRWYEVRVYPSWRGLAVYLQDVSEQLARVVRLDRERARRQAAQALVKTAIRPTGAASGVFEWLENIAEGFFTVDGDWRCTYLNGQAERLLGLPHEALAGQVVWAAMPLRGDDFERACRRAMSEQVALTVEAVFTPRDGWFRATVYPCAEGLAVYFRDTTFERAERQQLELLEASVAQLEDVVLITEAAPLDAPGPRIVYVNDAFVRLTGYAREDVLGKSPRLLQGPRTDRAELERIRDALSRFEPVHAELENVTRQGDPYWVELDILPVGAQGSHHAHFVTVQRNITQRKRDQDALRELNADLEARVASRTAELRLAREQAELATREKSAFLATMSHEIRTPMNGVMGMIDVLHQTSLKDYQVEMVELIRDSADSLLAIIDDILDFSKIEAGKLQVENVPMQVAETVEKVCALLDPVAVKRGVRLTVFIDPAIPRTLLGDPNRLRQVLVNLAANAIKFSAGRAEPGRVSVRAVLVGRTATGVTVELSVADNGIGMNDAALAHLFTPFSQADASTTRRFGGTGLGLAISAMLVRLMGGVISVRSEPDCGSSFSVRLQFGAIDAAEPAPPPALAGLQCRIVGAERPLADDLALSLAAAGARVDRAPDLAAAAATAQAPGLWVWLILPGPPAPSLTDLRLMAPGQPEAETRFVVLGWGQRRRPRVDAVDLVTLDADAMLRRTLFKVLALAAGRIGDDDSNDEQHRKPGPAAAPERDKALQPGRTILVAEDNETNRFVIRQQLELIGFAAELVVNGRDALACWRRGGFALLLTDLHMPEMDGYELAAAIRAEEGAGSRLPIIALSANALHDEELRCRDAGMDAFLTKPIRLPQLRAAIEARLGSAAPAVAALPAAGEPAAAAAPTLDMKVLVALVGDDQAVIGNVLQAFRRSAARASAAMAQGLADGSAKAVSDAAHMLKSGALSIGARPLGNLCVDIEKTAEAGRVDALSLLVPRFEAELAAVLCFLDSRQRTLDRASSK